MARKTAEVLDKVSKSVRNYRQDLIQSKSCVDETPVEFITDTFRPDKIHHHNTEYIFQGFDFFQMLLACYKY